MFDIKKEVLETHEALLTVQVEEEAVNQAMQKAARGISREVNIPGFRKGKAPYSRIMHYVGEGPIRERAADTILEEGYSQIIEKADISPHGPGELEGAQLSPMSFTIRIPLEPVVTLGDYQSVRAEWEEATVTDEEMSNVADQIREEHAILEPLDRPAQFGDEVHIDVVGTVDGHVFVDEEDIKVRLAEDTPFIAPGFVEALIGLSVDEEKSFTVALPENLDEASLSGAEAQFDVKVVGVYARVLPEFDDALASTVGAFETAEALKKDIYDRLQSAKSNRAQSDYQEALLTAVEAQAEVHYPPSVLKDAIDKLIEETERRIKRERDMTLEDALQLDGMTMEQLRENLTPRAEGNVKRSLVLTQLATELEIEVSDDEVVQEYSGFFAQFGMPNPTPENRLDLNSSLANSLRLNVLASKTLDQLVKIGHGEADVVETPVEVESEEAVVLDEAVLDETVEAVDEAPVEVEAAEAPEETPVEASTEAEEDAA